MVDLAPREVVRLYTRSQMSVGAIARELGGSNWQVSEILKLFDTPLRSRAEAQMLRAGRESRYHMDETFFSNWSPEMAWVLGLLLTDGHIYPDSTRAALTSKDVSLLEQVRDLMKSNFKVEMRATTPQLIINGMARTHKLLALGMSISKTTTVQFPHPPIKVLNHLVRGVWDGDGWISRDARSAATFPGGYPSAGIEGASPSFIHSLAETAQALTGKVKVFTRNRKTTSYAGKTWVHKNPTYSFTLQGEAAAQFIRWLYRGSRPEIRLERKYLKVVDLL